MSMMRLMLHLKSGPHTLFGFFTQLLLQSPFVCTNKWKTMNAFCPKCVLLSLVVRLITSCPYDGRLFTLCISVAVQNSYEHISLQTWSDDTLYELLHIKHTLALNPHNQHFLNVLYKLAFCCFDNINGRFWKRYQNMENIVKASGTIIEFLLWT